MSDELTIAFAGPFSWPGQTDVACVYDVGEGRMSGIYLWAVPLPEGHLIYYVGETGRSFSIRLRQHYEELATAMYHVYSAAEFSRGEKVLLWPGRYDHTERRSDEECRLNCTRLSEPIRDMMLVVRFFLAPLSCDSRIRRRAEAAISQALSAAPGIVGAFQDHGIRYWPRTKVEQPIACRISSPVPLLGLPERFWA